MSVVAPERPVPAAGSRVGPDVPDAPRGPTAGTVIRLVAAGCVAGAAAIHFGYAPAHFDEYWAYGLFFVGVACTQLLCAAALIGRPSRRALWAIAAVNLAVIVVWIVSRRVGAVIGPAASTTEPIG